MAGRQNLKKKLAAHYSFLYDSFSLQCVILNFFSHGSSKNTTVLKESTDVFLFNDMREVIHHHLRKKQISPPPLFNWFSCYKEREKSANPCCQKRTFHPQRRQLKTITRKTSRLHKKKHRLIVWTKRVRWIWIVFATLCHHTEHCFSFF